MVKEITCYGGEIVLVDDEDYPLLSRHTWHTSGYDDNKYAITKIPNKNCTERNFYMHNLILGFATVIDHEDRNNFNNQKYNLRPATHAQNEWNKAKQKTTSGRPCSSKYKGVSLVKGAWRAQIKRNGVMHYLGQYRNEEDAARAYNKKAAELSGDFVWLNPLPDIKQQA